MRAIGRRELSQLQPFDVLLLVVLGDLITQGALQSDMSVTGAMLAAGTFALLTAATSFVAYRFRRLRPVLEGEPLVVVMDGKVVEQNLARERLTIDDIQEEARERDRVPDGCPLGRPRDDRPDQLHPALSPRSRGEARSIGPCRSGSPRTTSRRSSRPARPCP